MLFRSLVKILGTELLQRIADLLFEAAGTDGALADGEAAATLLQVRRATIYGGSSEIQRNIVARRILELPS